MDIKTVDDIRELMHAGNSKVLADDGWASANFVARFSEVKDSCIPFQNVILEDYRMQFGVQFQRKSGCDNQESEHLIRNAAHMLHREIYGTIVQELSRLKYKMEASPKQECEYILDNLLDKLRG